MVFRCSRPVDRWAQVSDDQGQPTPFTDAVTGGGRQKPCPAIAGLGSAGAPLDFPLEVCGGQRADFASVVRRRTRALWRGGARWRHTLDVVRGCGVTATSPFHAADAQPPSFVWRGVSGARRFARHAVRHRPSGRLRAVTVGGGRVPVPPRMTPGRCARAFFHRPSAVVHDDVATAGNQRPPPPPAGAPPLADAGTTQTRGRS